MCTKAGYALVYYVLIDCTELAWCHIHCRLSLRKAFSMHNLTRPKMIKQKHRNNMQRVIHHHMHICFVVDFYI